MENFLALSILTNPVPVDSLDGPRVIKNGASHDLLKFWINCGECIQMTHSSDEHVQKISSKCGLQYFFPIFL